MSIQNVNLARFARNIEWDFFYFQTPWIVSTVKTSRLTHFCSKMFLSEKNLIFLLLLIYEKSLDPKESSRCFLCVPLGFIVSKEIISCPHFSAPTPAPQYYLFDDSLLNYLSKSNRKLECKYYRHYFYPLCLHKLE